jgi:hypothetical protein
VSPSTDQPASQPKNQPMSQPVSQSVSQSVSPLDSPPVSSPVSPPVSPPVSQQNQRTGDDGTEVAGTEGEGSKHEGSKHEGSTREDVVDPVLATFRISPLIRITLMLLYLALMLPLPFLPQVTVPRIPPQVLWVGIGVGAVLVYGAFSDEVTLSERGICLSTPRWLPNGLRKNWTLAWADVQALKPRSTGQGGLVYYFLSKSGTGYLLPMRVAGFAKLVAIVQAKTGLDTTDVRPLAQPWMYFTLLGLTMMLLVVDGWTIWTALHL